MLFPVRHREERGPERITWPPLSRGRQEAGMTRRTADLVATGVVNSQEVLGPRRSARFDLINPVRRHSASGVNRRCRNGRGIRGRQPRQRARAGMGRDRGRAAWGADAAAPALRRWRSGRPGMGHPASGGTVELLRSDLRPDAPGPLAAWRLHHQACLLEQVPGPADMTGGGTGPGADRALSACAVDARAGIAAAAVAARRWRRSGQDDRGGADRLRTDRAPAGAPRAGDHTRRAAAHAVGAGVAATLRPALHRRHRCRFVAGAAAKA